MFDITLNGDRIQKVKASWGQGYRPLWRVLENLEPHEAVIWSDRFSPMESIACEWALAMAFERPNGIEVPLRAQYLRSIYAEIQRIGWAFHTLSRVFKSVGHEVHYQCVMRLREHVFELQESLSGSRILPQIFCIGGVRREMSIGEAKKIKSFLLLLEYEIRLHLKRVSQDQMLLQRLRGLLPLTAEQCRQMKMGTVFSQASGHFEDLRHDEGYGVYDQMEVFYFKPKENPDWFDVKTQGDALARFRSLFFQIKQSMSLIERWVEKLPGGEIQASVNQCERLSQSVQVEGGSGLIVAKVTEKKIRLESHSMRLRPYIEHLLNQTLIDDMDLILAHLGFEEEEADLCGD